MIKNVDYKTIVDQLYNTEFSKDDDTHKLIKKTIANVNIGLLEKALIKRQDLLYFQTSASANFPNQSTVVKSSQ